MEAYILQRLLNIVPYFHMLPPSLHLLRLHKLELMVQQVNKAGAVVSLLMTIEAQAIASPTFCAITYLQ